eukprot:1623059-Pyramimonas_sp.AAC.2
MHEPGYISEPTKTQHLLELHSACSCQHFGICCMVMHHSAVQLLCCYSVARDQGMIQLREARAGQLISGLSLEEMVCAAQRVGIIELILGGDVVFDNG